jgi:hypothetical protein
LHRVLLTAIAAAAALGIVASSLTGWALPLWPIIAHATPPGWDSDVGFAEARPMIAVVVALFTVRWWPWLLLAGAVVSLPNVLALLVPTLSSHPSVTIAATAGPPMVLIAVLAAAQELFRRGARTAGVVVVALAIGTQLFSTGLTGLTWLAMPTEVMAWRVGLFVLGIAGAVLAVVIRPRQLGDAAGQLRPRVAVAAVGAVLLPLVAAVVDRGLVSRVLDVSAQSLSRHPVVVPAIVGLVILVGGVVLCAIAGGRVLFGAATMAVAQLAIVAPVTLALYAVTADPVTGWVASAVGVTAGCLAAGSRWRAQLAVGGGVLSALVLFILVVATGSMPEKLMDQQATGAGAVLLALLCATVTVMVASATPALAELGVLPAVFGPLTSVLVLGGGSAVMAMPSDGPDDVTRTEFTGVHHLNLYAGLLLLAAVLIAGAAAVEFLRERSRAEPIPS